MILTQVTEQERKGAEIDYLKLYGPLWLKSGGHQDPAKNNPTAQFQSQHPRFQALVDSQFTFFWCLTENIGPFLTQISVKSNLPC